MRKDTLSLIVATILWGVTFVVVKKGVEAYHPVSFLFLRFAITLLVLSVFMFLTKRKIKNEIFVKGVILGIFLFFGYFFQTVGLKYTTPSKSAFLTSLGVLFTPFISLFILKTKIKFRTVLAVILASVGIYLMFGLSIDTINIGDVLTILSAVCWAFHIVFVGLLSIKEENFGLLFVEVWVVLILSGLFIIATGVKTIPIPTVSLKGAIITSLFATIVPFYIQLTFQTRENTIKANFIYATEPVFAALFEFLFLGVVYGIINYVGMLFIFLSALLAQKEG